MSSWKVVNIIRGFYYKFFRKYDKLSRYRMEYCNRCEHKNGAFCNICGCFLDAKTRVDTERCPNDL